ncbi:hypothetical protein D3C87_1511380 [compost metagenome]
MKTIYRISMLLFAGLGLILSSNATAQEFKTNESIKAQLLQGTTPGLKTGPAAQSKQPEDNTKELQYKNRDFKAFLQKTSQGSGGGNAGIQTRSVAPSANAKAKTAGAQMPSEVKATEPEQKQATAPKHPPMQTEDKGAKPE